jgi:glutamine synthetase
MKGKRVLITGGDVLFEIYTKTVNIEALTMLSMAKRQIVPAAVRFTGKVAGAVNSVKAAGASVKSEKALLEKTSDLVDTLQAAIEKLEKAVAKAKDVDGAEKKADAYFKGVIPAMAEVRGAADELEKIVDADMWPLPTYAEMLFVK